MVVNLFAQPWITRVISNILSPVSFCSSMILSIDPMWVYAYDLGDSVRPDGELSNNMCDLAIYVLQDTCPPNKVIFPHLVTKYLLEGNFNATLVKRAFRRDQKYILSHKDLVCGCLVVYSSFLWACDNFSSHMWVTVVILGMITAYVLCG